MPRYPVHATKIKLAQHIAAPGNTKLSTVEHVCVKFASLIGATSIAKFESLTMKQVVISGTGLYTPPFSISNEELVTFFNAYAEKVNADNADASAAGEVTALDLSSVAFIEKASGIKSRYVMEKEGILDPARMVSRIPERGDD